MARRSSSSDSGGWLFKGGIFAVLAGAAFWLFNMFLGNKTPENGGSQPKIENPIPDPQTLPQPDKKASSVPNELLPAPGKGELVLHTYYALSYVEDHEQAEWVAYELTRERLNENWSERPNSFRPDPDVRTESATPRDYMSSGYDKGHLCPAADMAFNDGAIDETFYMSNMSPQVPAFNGGVWRELEECTRDWARKFKKLYVVTGPIFDQNAKGQIGFSKVTVPSAYYKVLYAPEVQKTIGFMLPNVLSEKPLMEYVCTIDAVEKTTGLDFFPKILQGLNAELEASLDASAWPVKQTRYEQRIQRWNDLAPPQK